MARIARRPVPVRDRVAFVSTVMLHAVLLCLFAVTSKVEASEVHASIPLPMLTPPMPIAVVPEPDVDPLRWPADDQSRIEYYRERDTTEHSCGGACSTAHQQNVEPTFAEMGFAVKPAGSCAPTIRAHRVLPGETLTSIARDYGFDDFRALYNKDVNEDLVDERPDPNMIMVDDLVVIPPRPGTRYCFVD